MKKLVSILLALALLCTLLPAALAAEESVAVQAFVTVSVGGEFAVAEDGTVVANVPVTAADLDGSGSVDIDEVLAAAHEAFYPGGAAAGYASSPTDWGVSMDMLWGDTSYSFGYYLNDGMAWSLLDPVADGDYIAAYVFADKEYFSDVYAYFDRNAAAADGGQVELTLFSASFDENWNVVFAPFAGASVTVDGADSGVVTDENGKAALTFDAAGEYLVSAASADAVLVPPVCRVTVAAAEPAAAAPAARTYTVERGDCLWSIARRLLGAGSRWADLFRANAAEIRDPNLIYAGQVLTIPD